MNRHFIAIRGMAGFIFSDGLADMAREAEARGWKAKVFHHYEGAAVLRYLQSIEAPYKLVVAGHSMGVDTGDDAVTAWGGRVDSFISIDSAFPETLPDSVEDLHSVVAENLGRFHVKGGQDVVNVVINGTSHTTVDNSPEMLRLFKEVLSKLEGEHGMQKPFYIGEGRQTSEEEIVHLAAKNGIPPYLALACAYKETPSLVGSWSSGALNALYEDHVAYRNTRGAVRDALVRAGLAAKGWRDLPYPPSPYPHIDRCAEIAGEEVAARATSWGLYQILGENYAMLGFSSALDMVRWLAESEANQFEGWIRFIDAKGLREPLLAEDLVTYSRGYNGSGFRTHGYDTELRALVNEMKQKFGAGFPEPPPPPVPTGPALPPLAPEAGPTFPVDGDLSSLPSDILVTALANSASIVRRHTDAQARVLSELQSRLREQKQQVTAIEHAAKPQKGDPMTFDFIRPNSKTFWTGALSVAAGLAMLILPADNMLAQLARSFFADADAGTLVTVGLGLIFGREAIAKNGIGN